MAGLQRNGTPWSGADERELVALLREGTPHTEIASKLGRSVPAITGKIGELRRRARGEVRPFAVLGFSGFPRDDNEQPRQGS